MTEDNASVLAVIGEAVRRGDAAALAEYAKTAEAAGNPGAAIALWQRTIAIKPDARYALALAQLFEKENRASEALEMYELVLKSRPGDAAAARIFAEATVRFGAKTWSADLSAAVRAQENFLAAVGDQPKARMFVLRQLMMHKEWSERIARGEAPYHAFSIDELFFRHARELVEELNRASEQVIAANPKDADARLTLAAARFCRGDRRGCEAMINSISAAVRGTMWETVRFDPAFYQELRGFSDEDLVRGLPPLIEIAPMEGKPKNIVYLSCNYSYFIAFALPMMLSMRDRSPDVAVHLHVMDPEGTQIGLISALVAQLRPLTVAISVEQPGLQRADLIEARCYYHAIRFIRFHAHLRTYQAPLWLMDVDAIINRDLNDLLGCLQGHDVALRVRPARIEPWNQFNACMIGADITPRSVDYFRQIAAYIAYFHQRKQLRWGIDQLAMYGVFADMQDRGCAPSLAFLGERAVDYDYNADGYVWTNSGGGKLSHMDRIRTPGAPRSSPPTTKFDEIFEKYWQAAVQTAGAVGTKL
jgi:sugar-specific transcriptional regulator TrmB